MKLTRYRSIPSFRKGINQQAGRNNIGKITVRHRGAGHKQSYRLVDWSRNSGVGVVVGFEYDPQRNAYLAKLYHKNNLTENQSYSYIVAPEGLKLFQEVYSYRSVATGNQTINKLLQPGDVAPLSFFEAGDFLHNVAAYPGQQPIFARSAGTFCQIRSINHENVGVNSSMNNSLWAKVRLPSGSQRLINTKVRATFGIVSTHSINLSKNSFFNIRKAGRSRWLGWRPSVRGVARNPVDHPHGGGQGKTSGGRPSVTFKSWPTKGQPTRSSNRKNFRILTPRKNLFIINIII